MHTLSLYIYLYVCVLSHLSSVHSLSHVRLFMTPWTAACQASLSVTNSRSLLKLMSIELVIPSNHLILCHPLLLLPSIFPSITVFSNESFLHIRWPKYWNFSFGISPSNEYSGLISFDCTNKTFDCVDHNKLWKILQDIGIPDHLTCLLRNLYAGQEHWTWNNKLVPNWERSTSRLYVVTLLI